MFWLKHMLGIECSWTGRAFEKDIKKNRIQELQIILVMESVIKNQFPQYSEANFELDVQTCI
ncbi:Integrase catalytic domain-containing protein [Aphis craccivora]|uniref:Integrase catalytic domain-containing protein n=1 Tax=Aphis craccivora TaxID=307492 RepID=A0A6G0VUA1_APHCR|nr:Integrase catalytic domain-containing protein [Aphis craccivora]